MQQYPQVSANFSSPAALDWLDAISESNVILSIILTVIHPMLYDAGWQTAKHQRDTSAIDPHDVLNQWASIFNGVAIISNYSTLVHQDGSLRCHWNDMLVTLKSYWNYNLDLLGLEISLEYGPDMVVGILGNVLEHVVPHFEGDRVCYAYFMRNNVHELANIPVSDWMYTKYYE